MKANVIQQCLCNIVYSQGGFWKCSNDITSPTHLNDIEEECFSLLDNLISVEDFKIGEEVVVQIRKKGQTL